MNTGQFNASMEHIVKAIKQAGYNPYEQLTGYITTGNEIYITRQGDARSIIKTLDINRIKEYLNKMDKANRK